MTIPVLVAMFVVAVLLHNAEEALWLPRWSLHAGRWYRPIGAAPFQFGVVVLSMLLVAVAVAGLASGPHSLAAYLLFGYVFAMAANALLPHLAVSVAMRKYMPGTATGLLLNLPIGGALLYRAVVDDWVSLGTLAWAAPSVAAALVLAIPVLLGLGRRLFPQGPRTGPNRGSAA